MVLMFLDVLPSLEEPFVIHWFTHWPPHLSSLFKKCCRQFDNVTDNLKTIHLIWSLEETCLALVQVFPIAHLRPDFQACFSPFALAHESSRLWENTKQPGVWNRYSKSLSTRKILQLGGSHYLMVKNRAIKKSWALWQNICNYCVNSKGI